MIQTAGKTITPGRRIFVPDCTRQRHGSDRVVRAGRLRFSRHLLNHRSFQAFVFFLLFFRSLPGTHFTFFPGRLGDTSHCQRPDRSGQLDSS